MVGLVALTSFRASVQRESARVHRVAPQVSSSTSFVVLHSHIDTSNERFCVIPVYVLLA